MPVFPVTAHNSGIVLSRETHNITALPGHVVEPETQACPPLGPGWMQCWVQFNAPLGPGLMQCWVDAVLGPGSMQCWV